MARSDPPTKAGLGSPTAMVWLALGALCKLSLQPIYCWEGEGLFAMLCCQGRNHEYTCSEQAEHSAGCYNWQLPPSLAWGPLDVRAWLLKRNVVKPRT